MIEPAEPHMNLLLQRLSQDGLPQLERHLERVELGQHFCLAEAEVDIQNVYFPESGVASITSRADPMKLEIGLVGREGFIGLPIALNGHSWPFASFVQISGSFWKMPAATFRDELWNNIKLHDVFLKYVQAYTVQVSSTAAANATHNIEERLARWLLMAHDRVDGNEIGLTHDFLAMMLGVRRPGVTVATHVLEGERAIRATRGKIQVLDRDKLLRFAGRSYGVAEAEYQRLTGISSDRGVGVCTLDKMPSFPTKADTSTIGRSNLQGLSVLVVEDDYVLARDADQALTEAGVLVVGPASSEEHAMALVDHRALQCALVDINLGEGVRFDVADALQKRGVPFAFVTGYDHSVIPARFNSIELIQKPANPQHVVDVAARLCGHLGGTTRLQARLL